MKKIVVRILTFFLIGCISPSGEGDKEFTVKNDGVFVPISYSINSKEVMNTFDLGEYETGSEPIAIRIDVRNNTLFPMTEMGLSFPEQVSKIFGFYNSAGDDGDYPGEGGTCTTVLLPAQSCQIVLSFYVAKSGEYIQEVLFSYKNLVEPDNRLVQLRILAGQPASLIFDDGQESQFFFGNQVGLALKPVLERADLVEYQRTLLISNKGELKASSLDISLLKSCKSYDLDFEGDLSFYSKNGFPQKNFCSPWQYTHDCPSVLDVNESCHLTISFIPPNQDPQWGFDQVLEEVNYQARISVSYINSPVSSGLTSLTGTFTTNSTTIQARFKTTKLEMDFGSEVIVGNRKADLFQIKNDGYREGELKMFVFSKDLTSNYHGKDKVYCKRFDADSNYLKCYNDDDFTEESTLADFPFIIAQRTQCFSAPEEDPVYIPIDASCVFDVIFQPSNEYLQRYDFKYNIAINYDSRFKGLETIKEVSLFEIMSSSLHAAKLEVASMSFDGRPQNLLGGISDLNVVENINLGRLALLNAGFELNRTIQIVFQNTGGAAIDNYKAFNGDFNSASKIELDKTDGLSIGPYPIKYFKNVKIDPNNCGQGGRIESHPDLATGTPASRCLISMEFDPISLDTTSKQNESMYDYYDESTNPVTKQKFFSFSFHDAANFSDSNIYANPPDITSANSAAWKSLKVAITADLIEKGFLRDYSTIVGSNGNTLRGNTLYKTYILHNIGTGPISWIPWTGSSIDHESDLFLDDGITRMAVSNPAAYGANYDCNNVIDFDFTSIDDNGDGNVDNNDISSINSRLTSKPKLGKLEKCVLRLRFKSTNKHLRTTNELPHPLATTVFSTLMNNTPLSLYNRNSPNYSKTFSVDFYDGDSTGQQQNPASSIVAQTYGEYFQTGSSHLRSSVNITGLFKPIARLVVANPQPFSSAVIVRPRITHPAYSRKDQDGQTEDISEFIVPRTYFAAQNIEWSNINCDFYRSCRSGIYMNGLVSTVDSSVDYVLHAGTFPPGKAFDISMHIGNITATASLVSQDSLVGDPEFQLKPLYELPSGNLLRLTAGDNFENGYNIPLTFMANAPGTYETVYNVTYTTGAPGDTEIPSVVDFKVKVVAEIRDDFGEISVIKQDYDTSQSPIVLSQNGSTLPTTYNHDLPPWSSEFKAVMVDTRSETSSFLKKRYTFINNSANPVRNFSLKFLASPIGNQVSSAINFSATALSKAIRIEANTCVPAAPLPTLDLLSNDSCYIDIWFQPNNDDATTNLVVVAEYDTGLNRNQFIQQNLGISFIPQSPSKVLVAGQNNDNFTFRDRQNNNAVVNTSGVGSGYNLDFGTMTYNAPDFSKTIQKTLTNLNTETRASFLKQYELYKGVSGSSGWGPNDINSDDIDIDGFITIYDFDKVLVKVNSICLFGGAGEANLNNEEKGFNANTSGSCLMKVTFRPGINMLARRLHFTKLDDNSEVYFELSYYTNNRTSTNINDRLLFTISARVKPPSVYYDDNNNIYQNITAYSGSEINFSWSNLYANSPLLGEVIGYRVYYSKFSNDLGDINYMFLGTQPKNPEYFDVYNDNQVKLDDNYISDLTRYYIKVVAIRENPGYNAGRFPGLAAGRFLSFTDSNYHLSVAVPSSDLFYNHAGNMFISYSKLEGRHKYQEAIDECYNQSPIYLSENNISKLKTFDLITQQAWDAIEADIFSLSDYPEVSLIRHWIKSGLVYDIDAMFSVEPGYDSNTSYQRFENLKQAYFRSSSSDILNYGTHLVAKTEGGLFNSADYEGYEAFMSPGIPEGIARCYVPLQ